jgi:acyl carrier protein
MSEDLTNRVTKIIADLMEISPDQITPDSTFEQLNMNSLDGLTLIAQIEEDFGITIPDEAAMGIRSVRQAVESLQIGLSGQSAQSGSD